MRFEARTMKARVEPVRSKADERASRPAYIDNLSHSMAIQSMLSPMVQSRSCRAQGSGQLTLVPNR